MRCERVDVKDYAAHRAMSEQMMRSLDEDGHRRQPREGAEGHRPAVGGGRRAIS
ncbi:MAG: hypothetical protein R3F43_30245 [bacterium]